MDADYITVPITSLLKKPDWVNFDVFLKLPNGKIIKIAHGEDELQDTLEKFHDRGVPSVLVSKDEYEKYLNQLAATVDEADNKEVPIQEKVHTYADAFAATKEILQKVGVNDASLILVEKVAKGSLKYINDISTLSKLIKKSPSLKDQHFLRKSLTLSLAGSIMEKFSWCTKGMKEKMAMAIFLCDIFLTEKELESMYKGEHEDSKINNHPQDTYRKLDASGCSIEPEVLKIILQHHELPDGSGYPNGINGPAFTQLAAIYVIADFFITQLYEKKLKPEEKHSIIEDIKEKFSFPSFNKFVDEIKKSVNIGID